MRRPVFSVQVGQTYTSTKVQGDEQKKDRGDKRRHTKIFSLLYTELYTPEMIPGLYKGL